jgi:hypothetical protein
MFLPDRAKLVDLLKSAEGRRILETYLAQIELGIYV